MTVEQASFILFQEQLNDGYLFISVARPVGPLSLECFQGGKALPVDGGIGGEYDFLYEIVAGYFGVVAVQFGGDYEEGSEDGSRVYVEDKWNQTDYRVFPCHFRKDSFDSLRNAVAWLCGDRAVLGYHLLRLLCDMHRCQMVGQGRNIGRDA